MTEALNHYLDQRDEDFENQEEMTPPNLSTIMRLDDARPSHVYRVEQLEYENEALKETIRIDWEVIVDAIDDPNIKQAVVRLWSRAASLLKEKQE